MKKKLLSKQTRLSMTGAPKRAISTFLPKIMNHFFRRGHFGFMPLVCILSLVLLTTGTFVLGQIASSPVGSVLSAYNKEKPLKIRLLSEHIEIAPDTAFHVGIQLEHETDWHSYWRNSGGFSLPTTVKWDLPEGFTVEWLRWPTPERYISQGFPSYVYHGQSILVAKIIPPKNLTVGSTVTLKAEVEGQVCKEACLLFNETPTIELRVAAAPRADEKARETLMQAVATLPRPLDTWEARASESAAGITLQLKPTQGNTAVSDVYFYSYTSDIDGQVEQALTQDSAGNMTLQLQRSKEDTVSKNQKLTGIVFTSTSWVAGQAVQAWEIDIPIGSPETGAGTAASDAPSITIAMIGLAFLGGLILNLMPCVFPVLGLKIMNFVNQAGEDHKKVVWHGVVFTLGVLISFWVLAGIIIALKSASGLTSYTWGFQLQDARFVLTMLFILFLFSLSLSGVFEFGVGATSIGGQLTRKSGLAGTFFSGVLATLVATPCAAPILANALGVALAMPPIPSLVLFSAIGLGLSFPYLLLSAMPSLVDKLPRPGAWMETFKKVMAFPMYATAAALLWVLSQQIEKDAFLNVLMALVCTALGAYIFGQWGQPWQKSGIKWAGRIGACFLIVGSAYWAWPRPSIGIEWETWSAQHVAKLRSENRPVFIDFTAAWCATCKANKIRYTHDKSVIELMKKKGVVALKADFTNKNPEIAQALHSYQRVAVPVNVLYRPGVNTPEILPELFGAEELIKRFSTLPDKK